MTPQSLGLPRGQRGHVAGWIAPRGGGGAGRSTGAEARRLEAALHDPAAARPETILSLQRMSGNRAVERLLAARGSGTSSSSPVAQRHALPPRGGEQEDDPNESPDRALQRAVADGLHIQPGAALPDIDEQIKARIGMQMTEDPTFQVETVLPILDGIEKALGNSKRLRPTFADARAKLAAVEHGAAMKVKPIDILTACLTALSKLKLDKRKTTEVTRAIAAVKASLGPHGKTAAARQFEAHRGKVRLDQPNVPKSRRAAFAAALKQLPSVGRILGTMRPTSSSIKRWRSGGASLIAEWGAQTKLSDNVDTKDSRGVPGFVDSIHKSASYKRAFIKKLDRVDLWFRSLLEPAMLLRVKKLPQIVMHTRGRYRYLGSKRSKTPFPVTHGFRPSGDKDKLELAYDERVPVIAHEVGHAVEEWLPISSWHDMNLLLEGRHKAERGDDRAARSGANIGTKGTEGRYAGTYATGKYTSTAYSKAGNAEVFSQAMEFFADPADAKKMIEKDPQHAAIILRSIRPTEYASVKALEEFEEYLPRVSSARTGHDESSSDGSKEL